MATVAVLAPSARVSVSLPAARSTEPLETAVVRVMASAPAPPIRVSTLLSVPVLPPAARVSLSAPAPRSTDMAVVSAVPRVMVSAPVPPVMVSTLATVAEFVALRQGQGIGPAGQIDAGVGDRAGQADGVGSRAGGERIDSAEGCRIRGIAKRDNN